MVMEVPTGVLGPGPVLLLRDRRAWWPAPHVASTFWNCQGSSSSISSLNWAQRVGDRGPVGVVRLDPAEVGPLDLEAARVVHLVGLDDPGSRVLQRPDHAGEHRARHLQPGRVLERAPAPASPGSTAASRTRARSGRGRRPAPRGSPRPTGSRSRRGSAAGPAPCRSRASRAGSAPPGRRGDRRSGRSAGTPARRPPRPCSSRRSRSPRCGSPESRTAAPPPASRCGPWSARPGVSR